MSIPQSLIEALRRRGLDIDYVIDILASKLELDPLDTARAHAELALVAFNEGLNFIDRGDVVQSSEKLYKAVEEPLRHWQSPKTSMSQGSIKQGQMECKFT